MARLPEKAAMAILPRMASGILASASTRSFCAALVAVGLLSGCPADDPEETSSGTTEAEGSTSTSTTADTTSSSSTTDPGSSSTTDESSSSTTDPGSSSTTDEPMTSSSSSGDPSTGSSTTDVCVPGEVDCECDAGSCDEGLDCIEDVCVDPLGCEARDDAEPNDSEDTAVMLPELNCDMVVETSGHVDLSDEDWYAYHGVDDGNCPTNTIALMNTDPALDVCMFFECDGAAPENVSCAPGSQDAVSPNGRVGCCGTGNVEFNTMACLGAAPSDTGTVYIQVQGPDEPACVAYDLGYRFL